MTCESDQWILTYQLSRSHDQGGRKLPPQKLMCGSFRPPILFLDVSSRFQYYLWLFYSANSQNMIDKPVVMWPNVSVKKIMTRNRIK
jgi:hypothetical protein